MLSNEPVFMNPALIAHHLCQPLRDELAKIKTAERRHSTLKLRKQGIETAALRHRTRSDASKRAWATIRANKRLAATSATAKRKRRAS